MISFIAMKIRPFKVKPIKPELTFLISESLSLLNSEEFPDANAIHDIRVNMKRSRASLKLISSQLEKFPVNRDICSLREVGRKMCSWRENTVLRKTLKELKKEEPVIFSALAANERITLILKKPATRPVRSEMLKKEFEEIAQILTLTRYRIRFLPVSKLEPGLLMKTLDNTYKVLTDVYITCRNNPKPEKLHEFRKRAKDFLYQLAFFRPLNPSLIKTIGKRLEIITGELGRFNDLAQLVRALEYSFSSANNLPAMDDLILVIRAKQDSCLSKVWPLAYKLFRPGNTLSELLCLSSIVPDGYCDSETEPVSDSQNDSATV